MADTKGYVRSLQARPLAVLVALGLILPLLLTGPVLAVHDEGLFELDENATAEGTAGDDWSLLDDDTGDPNNDDSALASEFVNDPFEDPATDHIFAQNSKDTGDVTSWSWKFGSPEDKNDIENAYTALYTATDGDRILYFGIDRMSNNGDAAMGLWFLQQDVDQVNTPPQGPNKDFSGAHTAGDILVQTDFTQGGTIERLDVYMWDCDTFFDTAALCIAEFTTATFTPELVGGDLWRIAEGTDCDDSANGDLACAQVNDSVVAAPWDYSYKCVGSSQPAGAPPNGCDGASGAVTALDVFPISTFFEGGLNLTDALGGEAVCLATMVAETRSSQSETATLDDKAMGSLDICGDIAVTKYKDANADGDRDTGEGGLSGWTVFIDEDGQGDLDGGELSGVTGATGTYTFVDLPPGSYTVCEVEQTNWERTDPSGTSNCKSGISPGDPATAVAFGNTPLSDLDVRFFDLTGSTNATVSCVAQGTTTPEIGTSSTTETATPETVYTASSERIGTYVCTIVITDP